MPVLLTTDHGSIHCHTPATVFAKRDTTSNLRYKFGEDLRAQDADAAMVVEDLAELSACRRGPRAPGSCSPPGDRFFVYPTKLREYQARYRGRLPARRRLAGGGHSSDRPPDAATGLTVRTELPAPAAGQRRTGGCSSSD